MQHHNLGVCRQIYRDSNTGNLVQYFSDACLLLNRRLVAVALRLSDNQPLLIDGQAFKQFFHPTSKAEALQTLIESKGSRQ